LSTCPERRESEKTVISRRNPACKSAGLFFFESCHLFSHTHQFSPRAQQLRWLGVAFLAGDEIHALEELTNGFLQADFVLVAKSQIRLLTFQNFGHSLRRSITTPNHGR